MVDTTRCIHSRESAAGKPTNNTLTRRSSPNQSLCPAETRDNTTPGMSARSAASAAGPGSVLGKGTGRIRSEIPVSRLGPPGLTSSPRHALASSVQVWALIRVCPGSVIGLFTEIAAKGAPVRSDSQRSNTPPSCMI